MAAHAQCLLASSATTHFCTKIQLQPALNSEILKSTSFWNVNNSRFFVLTSGSFPHNSLRARGSVLVHCSASTDSNRPLWLPGNESPSHLDGSLPGDFGFDPLSLGANPADLKWYTQAELIHGRFAMAGVAGMLGTDILRVTGLKDIPVWFEAGAAHYDFAEPNTLFLIQLILFAFVELKRYQDIKFPGSQGTEDSFFFFIEDAFAGLEPGYPGGPIFNPLGLASDGKLQEPLKIKEIKNGRLAMVAAVGFFIQALFTNAGPVENLLKHLSDPWHNTIIQTVSNTFTS